MKTFDNKCRECGTQLRDKNSISVGYCLYCYNMMMADPEDDEDDFQPCGDCDGHDACASKANQKIAELLIDSDAETRLANEVNALLIKLSQLEKERDEFTAIVNEIIQLSKPWIHIASIDKLQSAINKLEHFKASRKI